LTPTATTAADRNQGGAGALTVSRYGRTRFWAVTDQAGELVCVYKKGALAVASYLDNRQRFRARQEER